MSDFLQSCRQCYALIGLAIVITALLTVWSAGWGFNELGHLFGYLPYKYEACRYVRMDGYDCSIETYDGPQTLSAVMFTGFVICSMTLFSGVLIKCLFKALEALGRATVKSIQESL